MPNHKVSWLEKFLWTLYNISEEIEDLLPSLPRSWYEVSRPDYLRARNALEKERSRKAFRNLIYYLKRKGLIKDFKKEGVNGWLLTEKGKERILEIKWKFEEHKKRKDGKWIMVIFDIPEKIRIKRDFFRSELQMLGFQIFQKSIWVFAYDVLEETKKLIKKYFLQPYTQLLLIEEIQINPTNLKEN